MATDTLTRVKQLMALAESSFVEEARTAAFQAVVLIKRHNLLKGVVFETPPPPPPPPAKPKAHRPDPPSEPPPPAPPPPMTRYQVRQVAEAKAARFIEFLKKKEKLHRGYPFFSVRKLTDQSIRQHLINPHDRAVFHYYLGSILGDFRRQGVLVSVRSKGYALVPEPEKPARARKKRGG